MLINKHDLIHAPDAGNGYHGNCKHCGEPLVTDLGYCSWEGVKCIDREIAEWSDIPQQIKSFATFRGLTWNRNTKLFVKCYSNEEFTIDSLNEILLQL